MPSGTHEQAEAIARGLPRADAPARCRRARFQILRRSQQQQRQARIGGGELQPLARFQIELVDRADDGGRCARTQRFLERPQGLVAMRRLDQDQTTWIEAERAQAMTIGAAEIAPPVRRQNEEERVRLRQAGKQRYDEAEGCRGRAGLGHEFMQTPAGKAALRQVMVDGGNAEWNGGCVPKRLNFWQ